MPPVMADMMLQQGVMDASNVAEAYMPFRITITKQNR